MEIFGALLLAQDWDEVRSASTASEAAVRLDAVLQALVDECFPIKTRIVKSTDAPWMTERLRRLIRNKKRYYNKHGRNRVWKKKNAKVAALIKEAKKAYFGKVKERMKTDKNSKGYFQGAKIMSSCDAPIRWTIQKMYPGKSDKEIAEISDVFFNSISQKFDPLPPAARPPMDLSEHCPEIYQVAARLRTMKKPKGLVGGDIDPRLVSKYYDILAIPVQAVFLKVFALQEWPQL